jgi:predicted aspartyl protease
MRCSHSTFLVAAISIAIVSTLAQAGQIEDLRPFDLAHFEWVASGGQGWDRIAGVVLDGTRVEGGVPNRFEKTLDTRTGHCRMTQQTGPTRAVSGYDGVTWNAFNGIVNSVDLPPLVADARSRAFVDRAGWRAKTGYTISKVERSDGVGVVYYRPDGGSEIVVSFDLEDHTVKHVVFQTDDGPLTVAYSDWRRIGKVRLPFRQVETSNTGEVTTLEIKRVRLLNKIPPEMLARPVGSRHGRLASGEEARIPFRYLGSHILVSTTVNDVAADVVFDTGAANYFSPAWAQRFGLEVSGGLNLGGVGESSTTGGYALVKKISLGSAELADETVIVGPTPFGPNATAAGTVGFELLAEFRTTIDYPAQTITFAESHQPSGPLRGGTTLPFYSDGHSIYIEAEVDGRSGLFRLDTGDGNTVTLFPTFAQEHDLYQTTAPAVVAGAGVGGAVTARNITLSRFKLGGTEFREIPARMSLNRAGSFASRSLAGNLGGSLLRCFRITVDYAGRLVVFQSDPERLRGCVTTTHK